MHGKPAEMAGNPQCMRCKYAKVMDISADMAE